MKFKPWRSDAFYYFLKTSFICVLCSFVLTTLITTRKWSRREEADFYRVVSSFGVEYKKEEDRYEWTRFRSFGRLERKLDDTLTEYFKAFYAMCKRVTGRRLSEEEENLPISVDPISEERASRCLARIDLLSKIREEILTHPELDERLQLCQQSMDLPDWWQCGKHDKDLLVGAARYGLNRLDFNLMNDPELSFKDVVKQFETANEERKVAEQEIRAKSQCVKEEEKVDEKIDEKTVESNEIKNNEIKEEPASETTNKPATRGRRTRHARNDSNKLKAETKAEPKAEVKDEIKEEAGEKNEEAVESDVAKESETKTEKAEEKAGETAEANEETSSKTNEENQSIEKLPEEKNSAEQSEESVAGDKQTNEINDEGVTTKESDSDKAETCEGSEEKENEAVVKDDNDNDNNKVERHEDEEKMEVDKDTSKDSKETSDNENEKEVTNEVVPETESEKASVAENEAESASKEESESKQAEKEPEDEETHEKAEVTNNEEEVVKKETNQDETNDETVDKKGSEMEVDETKAEANESKEEKVDDGSEPIKQKAEEPKVEEKEVKNEADNVVSSTTETDASVAQLLASQQLQQNRNSLRWPKDRVLQMRLEQLCYTVEKNEWPSLRHSFFSLLSGQPIPSTPSITTADSSPRPLSPGSLSSASREPTPHPTPEQTPRRETMSPLQDYFYTENGITMSDSSGRRRRRRRRRYEVEQERVKLRNLLSQTIEQQLPSNKKQTSLLSGNAGPQFLPPLFSNLPFCNLRSTIRDDLLSDEKTASLLLGHTLQQSLASAVQSSQRQQEQPTTTTGPPPAHQNSAPRRSATMGTLDLTSRFKPSPPPRRTPPAPAHKPPPPPSPNAPEGIDVLDLRAGSTKRSRYSHSFNKHEEPVSVPKNEEPSVVTNLSNKRSGKKIGSRIDALALNLQAKKMMEEKKTDVKPSERMQDSTAAFIATERRKASHFMEELSKHSSQIQSKSKTPPAAHSGSSKTSDMNKQKANSFNSLVDPSKMTSSKDSETASIAEKHAALKQDLRKWLEEHPDFVAQNPSLAAAAVAAMAFNPITSIPANVS